MSNIWIYGGSLIKTNWNHSRGNLSSSLPSSGHVISSSKWSELHSKLSEVNAPEEAATLELEEVLGAEALNNILSDSDIRAALFPFVSESSSSRSEAEIEQLVSSQQFQQRLQVLNAALQQDTLNSIVEELETEKGIVWL